VLRTISSVLQKTHAILRMSRLSRTKVGKAKEIKRRTIWIETLKILLGELYNVSFANLLVIFNLNFGLLRTLASIDQYARKKVRRSSVGRFLMARSDIAKTYQYRERLSHALNIFWVCTTSRTYFAALKICSFSAAIKPSHP
jgi:hypothetical protein